MTNQEVVQQIQQYCYSSSGRLNPNLYKHTWWQKRNIQDVYQYIINFTYFLDDTVSWKQRLWHVENFRQSVNDCLLISCTNKVNWNENKYQTYCSVKCNNRDEEVIRNRKETMISKYGAPTTLQSESLTEKVKSTNVKRYGAENPLLNRNIRKKVENTNRIKYGVDNPLSSDEVRKKRDATMIENYGASTTLASPSLKEKVNNTKLVKYGTETYNNRKKATATIQEKYGVSHQSQKHISPDTISKLADKDWLEVQIDLKTCTEIANELGLDTTTICNYAKLHNIKLPYRVHSAEERKLANMFDELKISYIHNDRTVLSPKELDFYLPEYKLAIEMNGIYWHSTASPANRDKNYHFDKWMQCRDKGITLLSYTDADLIHNFDVIKAKMLYHVGINKVVVGARKCTIGLVSNKDEFELLDRYHIQGRLHARSGSLGAYYNNRLIAVINWAIRKKYIEITRYCCDNQASYPGLFSKMLKAMIKETQYTGDIVSFSNNDHSNGNVYKSSGFTIDKILGPAYWYTRDFATLENRQKYMKSKIADQFGVDMTNKTERQAMQELGYHRYYDSGKIKWVYSTSSV